MTSCMGGVYIIGSVEYLAERMCWAGDQVETSLEYSAVDAGVVMSTQRKTREIKPLWLNLSFALLFLVVQLAPFAHLGLEKHELCPAHGVVHGGHHAHAQGLQHRSQLHSNPAPDGHGHDLCALHQGTDAPTLRAKLRAQFDPPRVLPARVAVAAIPHASTHRQRAIYHLAPKQGPPV